MATGSIIPRPRADETPVEPIFDGEPVFKPGKYLTFRVARHDWAMLTESVRGILPLHQMIAIEKPHAWLCGSASVNGHDFPVIDLRAKLGLQPGSRGREPMIVVVESGETHRLAGFIADRVAEIIDLRSRDFRNGAVRSHGRVRRVLDPDQIMTEADWLELVSP